MQASPVIKRVVQAFPVIKWVVQASPATKRVVQASPATKWVEQASPAIKRVDQASPAIKRVVQVSPVRQDHKRKQVKVEPEDESVLTIDDSSSQVDTEDGSVGSSTSIFCTKCDEIFQTVDELVSHEKTCYKGHRYPCTWPGCVHINSQKSLLCQHVKGVHEKNPYRCSLCPDETFIYKKSHDKHVK